MGVTMNLANILQNNTIYNVGLYLRLSREDENDKESESIANQRLFLMSYVLERGWVVIDEYIDDGYTGTNFQRPGFQRMLGDINSKRINCVITKDMSRLGRDYIETGYYIEKFFPQKNIRYIAISDGIDTHTESSGLDITPFKAVINDLYAKDISKKVRDAFEAKKKAGEFIGAFAPYGYLKDPCNKNKLIIDNETALVVKRIFDLYIEGNGYTSIAKCLTSEGISNPTQYKKQRFSNYQNPHKINYNRWTPDTIRKMLCNPTYIGNMTQSKQKTISYKVGKKVKVPKEKWIIVENTHEAIVSKKVFEDVQILMSRNISHSKKNNALLTGMFFCGDCGSRMTYSTYYTSNNVCKIQYVCVKYKRFSDCTRHGVMADDIEPYIVRGLKSMVSKILDYESLLNIANEAEHKKTVKNKYDNEIKKVKKKLEDVPRNLKQLYIDKLNAVITEEEFFMLKSSFEEDSQEIRNKLSLLCEQKSKEQSQLRNRESIIDIVKTIISFESIDKQILIKLIKKIEFFDDKRIVIQYNFQNPSLYNV